MQHRPEEVRLEPFRLGQVLRVDQVAQVLVVALQTDHHDHDREATTTSATVSPVSSETTEETTPATAAAIETGGGGTAGPGAGIWALGILALALAGGLGWTAVRPAVKRK